MPARPKRGRHTAPKRAVLVTAEIPDDAPPAIREGLARRRLVATTGRCPCGAELVLPCAPPAGALTVVAVEHEDDCPANDQAMAEAIAGWHR